MDNKDKEILKIIQKNASIPLSELSKRVGISSTPCWNRIRKMEEAGIILSIHIPNHSDEWLLKFKDLIKKYDQIIETHRINGSHDYILKILSPSMDKYDEFQQNFIRETGCINMQTSFSQKEIKNSRNLPLDFI